MPGFNTCWVGNTSFLVSVLFGKPWISIFSFINKFFYHYYDPGFDMPLIKFILYNCTAVSLSFHLPTSTTIEFIVVVLEAINTEGVFAWTTEEQVYTPESDDRSESNSKIDRKFSWVRKTPLRLILLSDLTTPLGPLQLCVTSTGKSTASLSREVKQDNVRGLPV